MSTESPRDIGTEPAEIGELEYVIDDGDATRCTVFPSDCDEERLVTHWITAEEESFVSLARMQ